MSVEINQDFADMVSALLESKVDFLIVGAYALSVHGLVRATEDIDIFVRPSKDNAMRVVAALRAFGAPLQAHDVIAADFEKEGTVYQIGLPPRRVDILTSISGVSYDEAIEESVEGQLGSFVVRFIGKKALLKNKKAAGRDKDLVDAKHLKSSM